MRNVNSSHKNDSRTKRSSLRLSKLTGSQRNAYHRALEAIHLVRTGQRRSLTGAAREAGTTSRTVAHYAGGALSRRGSRYKVKGSDRLRRELTFYDSSGKLALVTHSSRQATAIAKYHNAIKAYLIYGDDSALSEFDGKSIVVHGKPYPFLTDRRVLNRLARAGELNFLEIYTSIGA